MSDIKAIILAAGLGTRLGDLTKTLPKCLVEIKGKSLLERQIDLLKRQGIDDIIVVVGAKGECWTQENINRIKEICSNIIINFDNASTQNAYSLSLGLKEIKEPSTTLIIDGDIFFEETMLKEILNLQHKTLIISEKAKSIDSLGSKVLTSKGGKVVAIGKTLQINESQFPWYIYGAIMKIDKKDFEEFKEECGKLIYYKEDVGHPLNFYCQNHDVHNLISKSQWINMNTIENIKLAEDITNYEYTIQTKNVLIIGASGFLGKKLFDKLSRSFQTYGTYASNKKSGELLYLDITNKEATERLIKRVNPQIIIHTAALANADFCEENKELAYSVNVKGTQNIIDVCKKYGIKLIFFSSDYIYDGDTPPYTEESIAKPVNYYGETKLECEKLIKQQLDDYIILRPTIFYGFNDEEDKNTFVMKIIRRLRSGEDISVDDYIMKYPILIDDIANIMKVLLEKDVKGEFNLGTEKGVTRYRWALQIAEVFELDKSLIQPEKTENIAKKPNNVCYSALKIKQFDIKINELDYGLRIMKNQERCMFRMIYSLRPDKNILGQATSLFRITVGKELAKEYPIEADMVIGVPESGIYGALGYAEESKMPFHLGVIRDEYSRRTLLYERLKLRSEALREKLIVIPDIVKGKDIVLIDETIASGKTLALVIELLKNSGVKKIHVRIPCPIMVFNCKNNILDRNAELIAAKYFAKGVFDKEGLEEELKKVFEVDSLRFISFDGFLKCFNYNYNIKPCVECLMKEEKINLNINKAENENNKT